MNKVGSLKVTKRGLGVSPISRWIIAVCFMIWLGVVGYYLITPLLPVVQNARMSLFRINPYKISYNATTQLLVALSPQDVRAESDTVDPQELTIEYVDPNQAKPANLEAHNATLSIESIDVSGKIVDGVSQDAMFRGFWHYPLSAVPGIRGNTVIFGHRFYKLPPIHDTFYNLDKIQIGDAIIVSIDDETITYTVVATRVVEKTDSSVLAQTGDYRLRLMTCTPLWTSHKRLAIIAIQDEVSNVI